MISVLLPTFNQAQFLPDCLASLAAQTRRDFELIVCDDGSTDGTAKFLPIADKTVMHPANLGSAAAINSAAALAAGDARYLTWVSSDNVMHPRWLERLAGELDDNSSLGAVYSAFNFCQQGGETRVIRQGPYEPDKLVASENCYFGPSFLIRREVWPEHRGGLAHDYDSWARVEEECWARGLTLGYVDEPLCDYHKGDWNTSLRRPDLYDAPYWQTEALRRRERIIVSK